MICRLVAAGWGKLKDVIFGESLRSEHYRQPASGMCWCGDEDCPFNLPRHG